MQPVESLAQDDPLGLAGPGQSGAQVQRTGRGAEILILMDRSSSMDATVHTNGLPMAGRMSQEPKAKVVRDLLSDFVARRPDNRFAFMTFSTVPIAVVPFTQKTDTVQAALAAVLDGRTSVVVAHRLSTVRAADRIIVLQGGQIIEAGDHPTLLAQGGHYATLYATYFRHQAAAYEGLTGD